MMGPKTHTLIVALLFGVLCTVTALFANNHVPDGAPGIDKNSAVKSHHATSFLDRGTDSEGLDPELVEQIGDLLSEHQSRVDEAFVSGDFSNLTEDDIDSALFGLHLQLSINGRSKSDNTDARKDQQRIWEGIRQLEAERLSRNEGLQVNVATSTNKPSPNESFVTLEWARQYRARYGEWPQQKIWDLGQAHGQDPRTYLSSGTTTSEDNSTSNTQTNSIPPKFDRVSVLRVDSPGPIARHDSPTGVPANQQIVDAQSLVRQGSVVVISANDQDIILNYQGPVLAHAGASDFNIVGEPNSQTGITDPIGDIISLVRNRVSQNLQDNPTADPTVDLVISGHGQAGAVRLGSGNDDNDYLDLQSVSRLNDGLTFADGTPMLNSCTLFACSVAGDVNLESTYFRLDQTLIGSINAYTVTAFTDSLSQDGDMVRTPNGPILAPTALFTGAGTQRMQVQNNFLPRKFYAPRDHYPRYRLIH